MSGAKAGLFKRGDSSSEEEKRRREGKLGFPVLSLVLGFHRRMPDGVSGSKGKVKVFNWTLGYGLITSEDGGKNLVLLRPSIKSEDYENLQVGDTVEFRVSAMEKGNTTTEDVTRCGSSEEESHSGSNGTSEVVEISSSAEEGDDIEDPEEDDIEDPEEYDYESSDSLTIMSMDEKKDEEEDLHILNVDPSQPHPVDPNGIVSISDGHLGNLEDEDISIIAERGQVACRDYPHARHLCVNYPFNKTAHENCCPQCYCYVCDSPAPCKYWKAIEEHCHAFDKEKKWKDLRIARRSQNT